MSNKGVVIDARQLFFILPDSALFSSANPSHHPILTFNALSPVTGWVMTAGWCVSKGGRFGV